jgi:ammonium transporter, Amt family
MVCFERSFSYLLISAAFFFDFFDSYVTPRYNIAGLRNIGYDALAPTAPAVSAITFMLFQMQFATITAGLIFGSAAERIRLGPAILFIFIWTTIVYDPVAYWTWAYRGWLKNLSCLSTIKTDTPCGIGALDFAGGGPVHIASGFAGLAVALVLGRRKRSSTTEEFKPHHLTNIFIGTGLLWFGWFAFNGASAGAGTARAVMAATTTQLSAAAGGLAWALFDYSHSGRLSGLGFCSGAVAGLVAVTPASGYIAPWAAVVIGLTTGIVCNYGCRIKEVLGVDDALDAFGVHGVGGLWGNVLAGVFAMKGIAGLDNSSINGGAIDGNWIQIAYQLVACVSIAGYSFVLTFLIAYLMSLVPALNLRMAEEDEYIGADVTEMGEVSMEFPLMGNQTHSDAAIVMSKSESEDTFKMAGNIDVVV